jgi:hypothetical protein
LQQMADRTEFMKSRAIGSDEEHGRDHPINDQPDHEQIETLEGVEADRTVMLEFRRCEHDDSRDPTDDWNVAKHGCDAGIQISQEIGLARAGGTGMRWRGGSSGLLLLSALGAENVDVADLSAALGAVWHVSR